MRSTAIAVLALAAVALTGCGSAGMFAAGSFTTVELSEPNYEILATGVSGQAKAAYLLGITYSDGPVTQSLSLARISGSGQLYKEAMEGLWRQFEAEHGAVTGRHLALVNVRYDADTHNFLLYNDVTLSIRADVIEFVDEPGPGRGRR